ncbi:flagellar biosynthesis protein FlhA [Motilibacter rhizosphaerae]
MLVVPLPTVVLDMLIAANIAFALVILLLSMFVSNALDFSIFPTVVLIATLFRLALNVSATRLVLRDGFAGHVIDAFGHFVVGGNLVIGLVIFFILVVIQFMVITKGSERVAEVGARFTLDAMPGKQMAIDADLNQGLIDEGEARKRREAITAEADFYGAMDGASKFVKGDATAAVLITSINLIGGFIIGVVQHHQSPGTAMTTYSLLSVGDGLVSQIPALLLSVSTGLIVTRSASQGDLGSDFVAQLGKQLLPLRIAGGAVLALCLIPGLPKLPFLAIGSLVLYASTRVPKPVEATETDAAAAIEAPPGPDSPEQLAEDMRVDALALELACDLIDLVDTSVGGDLLDRVRSLRRKIALELGLVLPPVRTRDDLELPLSTYVIKIGGIEAGRGEAPPGTVLAIGESLDGLPGTPTKEPVFGLTARWVPIELRAQAEMLGATVVDRTSVLTTHLAEVVRQGASRLLGREDVRSLVDMVKRTHPVVVEELTPAMLTLGEVQRVLHSLLDEHVSIRDLPRIFEALSLRAKVSSDTEGLVEAARTALGPAIAAPYVEDGTLRVITFEPRLEQSLFESMINGDGGTHILLDPVRLENVTTRLAAYMEAAEQRGVNPVLVCSPQVRGAVSRLVRTAIPRMPVLSYSEVQGQMRIETIGVVDDAHALAA